MIIRYSPETAYYFCDNTIKTIALLKDQPEIGISLAEKVGWNTDIRYLLLENHIAFYRVENATIKIIRVLDQRTDYMQTILKDNIL